MFAKSTKSNNAPQTDIGFYRLPQITDLTGMSRSNWWKLVKDGKAPKGIKLSPRITVWKKADIHEYLQQIAANQNSESR